MLSIIANHHDEHFPSGNVMRLHSLEEFEAYCNKCREYHIKPEFEIWHMGSYWNLKWMINQGFEIHLMFAHCSLIGQVELGLLQLQVNYSIELNIFLRILSGL